MLSPIAHARSSSGVWSSCEAAHTASARARYSSGTSGSCTVSSSAITLASSLRSEARNKLRISVGECAERVSALIPADDLSTLVGVCLASNRTQLIGSGVSELAVETTTIRPCRRSGDAPVVFRRLTIAKSASISPSLKLLLSHPLEQRGSGSCHEYLEGIHREYF